MLTESDVFPLRPCPADSLQPNNLKEIFGSGTAVVVLPISGFGFEYEKFELPSIENPWSLFLKKKLNDIQYNIIEDPYGWRVKA